MMNYILFAIFFILQALDFWTTYKCLTLNKGHEGNPIVAFGISKIGLVPALAIYKSLAIIVGWFVKDVLLAIIILDIVYAYIIYQNYRIMKL
jgi:hypothetical protein